MHAASHSKRSGDTNDVIAVLQSTPEKRSPVRLPQRLPVYSGVPPLRARADRLANACNNASH